MTLKERVLRLISQERGLTDRELTDRLLGRAAPQQGVNQAARVLHKAGQLVRRPRADGLIGNYPTGRAPEVPPAPQKSSPPGFIAEDDLKRHIVRWLEADGWVATVAWGRTRGIDIDARRESGRWIIEAKGQGSSSPMRVNFFLGVLSELLQRMNTPDARYSVALPDLPQYRGLWQRLPRLAKERTQVTALFVKSSGEVEEVR